MPLKLKERNISNTFNRLKNSNWREADQLAIYMHERRVELGFTKKQLQFSGQNRRKLRGEVLPRRKIFCLYLTVTDL